MAHDHHHHGQHQSGSNIKVAFFLNLGFTILEIIGGIWINSVAILSDALHDLGDSLSLGLAWYFENVAKRGRDHKYTFGYKRFALLGAVINSVVLLVGSFIILSEAVPRIWNPQEVHVPGMIAFAILGVIVNGAAVLRLKGGSSLNERVVRLHLMEDVLGWVAVLVGGIILYFFDLPWIDPLLSVVITLYVLYNVVRNLRETMNILLQGSPSHIKPEAVEAKLQEMEEINSVHDLHIWTLDGAYNVLTVHAVATSALPLPQAEELKKRVRSEMAAMDIQHVTIELESPGEECSHEGSL
ncbi:cation diffusion facilitator family transporter [Pontibacter flavimaris]|uniref:Cobalt transporter n=1 Tax=Pontibacter flavimaris TaxID=1797110 RepID=A0A1Q5P8E4_9BACT|nr:cation diffusion facilitator family transporter [Pontibacter flavimaris]OKL38463.1 cobalt transporter [Pontibacter flavimaris]